GKEGLSYGEMMPLCVGPMYNMLDFIAKLDYALTKLKSHFQVFYAGCKDFAYSDRDEMNLKMICTNIPSISISQAHRFWQRIAYLCNDLTRLGGNEKILEVRRM
ncbi:hypothetical protein KI387_034668, partial [Taxus chinensis]